MRGILYVYGYLSRVLIEESGNLRKGCNLNEVSLRKDNFLRPSNLTVLPLHPE